MRGKFDYYTIEDKGGDVMPFAVYGWSRYPRGSVMEGQTSKSFIEVYANEAEARAAYPQADEGVHRRSANNSVSHLPGENDHVPGGALPDDYEDGI
jgi:hypothetical protein